MVPAYTRTWFGNALGSNRRIGMTASRSSPRKTAHLFEWPIPIQPNQKRLVNQRCKNRATLKAERQSRSSYCSQRKLQEHVSQFENVSTYKKTPIAFLRQVFEPHNTLTAPSRCTCGYTKFIAILIHRSSGNRNPITLQSFRQSLIAKRIR